MVTILVLAAIHGEIDDFNPGPPSERKVTDCGALGGIPRHDVT